RRSVACVANQMRTEVGKLSIMTGPPPRAPADASGSAHRNPARCATAGPGPGPAPPRPPSSVAVGESPAPARNAPLRRHARRGCAAMRRSSAPTVPAPHKTLAPTGRCCDTVAPSCAKTVPCCSIADYSWTWPPPLRRLDHVSQEWGWPDGHKNGVGRTDTIVVQCKHQAQNVGRPVLQQLWGVLN